MTPATQPARTLAVAEAMAGQLYVAIFIARLVALHITHTARERSRD
jgi:transaldolase